MAATQNNRARVFGPKVFDPSLARKILAGEEEEEEGWGEHERVCTAAMAAVNRQQMIKEIVVSEGKEEKGLRGGMVLDEEFEAEEAAAANEEEQDHFFNHMQEVLTQLSFERRQKDHCLSKLKDIENQLEQFSYEFFKKLKDLRSKVDI